MGTQRSPARRRRDDKRLRREEAVWAARSSGVTVVAGQDVPVAARTARGGSPGPTTDAAAAAGADGAGPGDVGEPV
jgi:hypothetical protein